MGRGEIRGTEAPVEEGAMSYPAIVIVVILAVGILFVLLPVMAYTFARYRAPRVLACPETGEQVRLGLDATRAALTSALGRPRLRVRWCSLWPGRSGCGQTCLRLPEVERP